MFPGNSYGRFAVSQSGQLSIHGVLKQDAGFIVCSALSVAGSATARAFLQVKWKKKNIAMTSVKPMLHF